MLGIHVYRLSFAVLRREIRDGFRARLNRYNRHTPFPDITPDGQKTHESAANIAPFTPAAVALPVAAAELHYAPLSLTAEPARSIRVGSERILSTQHTDQELVMKIGLVGYQAGGKSSIFELLTGTAPDISKAHTGQVGTATVPDQRFDDLVALFHPKKISPAKIELFDTPGLSRDQGEGNAQRMSVLREANVLIQVIGAYAGADPAADAQSFEEDLVLADMQVVSNRVARLRENVKKPRPDREELQTELELLEPIEAALNEGQSLRGQEFSDEQEKHTKSFSLLTRKPLLVLINTAEADFDPPSSLPLKRWDTK